MFKEKVDVLKEIAGGQKEGQDWRNGMAEAKPGKQRTWQQYHNHAVATIRQFPPIGTMDDTIKNCDQALVKINHQMF